MENSLEDVKVNVKIKLAGLWIALMFFYAYNDILSFFRKDIMDEILTGEVGGITIDQTFLLAAGILMSIPIFMIFLSLMLPAVYNRWVNIIVGIFHIIVLAGSMLVPGDLWINYALYEILEAIFILLIIWFAWTWPKSTSN